MEIVIELLYRLRRDVARQEKSWAALYRTFSAAICSVAIFLCASLSSAASNPRRVLLLHSVDNATLDAFARDFRTELARDSAAPIDFLDVWMQPPQFNEDPPGPALVDYLRSKYADHQLDLIVPTNGPAVVFAQKYRAQLFPATPMLLAGVDQRWVQNATLTANDTAVSFSFDPSQAIEQILRLRPQTTHIFVVLDTVPLRQFWRAELEREHQRFNARLTFGWSHDLSFQDLLRQAATLPPNSAIFYIFWSVDRDGTQMTQERVLTELHAAADAPIFALFDFQLGQGVVGGLAGSIAMLAQNTAVVAVRILRGESPGEIRVAPQKLPSEYDWRELQRWHIREDRLPPDSIVRFREPSVWNDHKAYILGGFALLLLQTALIAGLLVHRVRLRDADAQVRRSRRELRASYDRIRDLGGRLLRAQEDERARVARELHDDIGQQVALLAFEVESLRPRGLRSVDRRFDEAIHRLRGIAKSLHDLSHRLHPGMLQIIGLVAALRDLARELSRSDFTIAFADNGVPTVLPPETTLTLFRVVQEALQNAVKHGGAHHVSVELRGDPSGLALTIADDGIGFDVDEAYQKGLGLRSMYERLESIGATLKIASRPGVGTRLEITAPLPALKGSLGEMRQQAT
jgi:signal transduction histidine kinase